MECCGSLADSISSLYSAPRRIVYKRNACNLVYLMLTSVTVLTFAYLSYQQHKDLPVDSVSNHPELDFYYDNLKDVSLEQLPFFNGNFLEKARRYDEKVSVDDGGGLLSEEMRVYVPLDCVVLEQNLGVCDSRYGCMEDSDCTSSVERPFTTGICNRTARKCLQRFWCPEPAFPNKLASGKLRLDVAKAQIRMKSSVSFPELSFRTSNDAINAALGIYASNCTFEESTFPTCPVFRLDDLLAGPTNQPILVIISERYRCEEVRKVARQHSYGDNGYGNKTATPVGVECHLSYEIHRVPQNDSAFGWSIQASETSRVLYFCSSTAIVQFSSTAVVYQTRWTLILYDLGKAGAAIFGVSTMLMLLVRWYFRHEKEVDACCEKCSKVGECFCTLCVIGGLVFGGWFLVSIVPLADQSSTPSPLTQYSYAEYVASIFLKILAVLIALILACLLPFCICCACCCTPWYRASVERFAGNELVSRQEITIRRAAEPDLSEVEFRLLIDAVDIPTRVRPEDN